MLLAQVQRVERTISAPGDSIIQLNDPLAIPSSIAIIVDKVLPLQQGDDFRFENGAIILHPRFMTVLFSVENSLPRSFTFDITYRTLPLQLKRKYSLHSLVHDNPTSSTDTTIAKPTKNSAKPDKSSTTIDFKRSGGITRGVGFGTTQDASVQGSFNLTFAGTIDSSINFVGALSEESTQIQPDGNTFLLRDLDRIYITGEKQDAFHLTLGDLTAKPTIAPALLRKAINPLRSVFTDYNKKVLGASAHVRIGSTVVSTTASTSRGIFHTNNFSGRESFQGPYRLTGKNGEQRIIVIAGTEKVYINGTLMSRGENYDYVIDYGIAEIRFQPKQIITSLHRITVEFEYTVEYYNRSLITAGTNSSFFDNKLQIATYYYREGDNQDALKNLELSGQDKTTLIAAGSDASKAYRSGVSLITPDSQGNARGVYTAIDTVIGTDQVRIYRYSPFDTSHANYNVSFGYVGRGNGSYARINSAEFSYVGPGAGTYDTLVYLPLPQLHQMFGGMIAINPLAGLNLQGEYALSRLDRNRFSSSTSIQAPAYNLSATFNDTIGFAGTEHLLKISASSRKREDDFVTPERDRPVEYLRNYGLSYTKDYSAFFNLGEQLDNTVSIGLSSTRYSLSFGASRYKLQDIFTGDNYHGNVAIYEDSSLIPNLTASAQIIPNTFTNRGQSSDKLRFNSRLHKTLRYGGFSIQPYITLRLDNTDTRLTSSLDSVLEESGNLQTYESGLTLTRIGMGKTTFMIQRTNIDSLYAQKMIPVVRATMYQTSFDITPSNGFSVNLDLGYREKEYLNDYYNTRNGGDQSGLFIRFAARFRTPNNFVTFDAQYQLTQDRSAQLERIFLPVMPGTGRYRYIGDMNNNGRQDVNEFEIARYQDQANYVLVSVPTESLIPTTDLRSSARLRLTPSALLQESNSTLSGLVKAISTETYIHVDERNISKQSDDIYLYRLSRFLSDSSTVQGIIELQQDIHLLENDPGKQFRFRFIERRAGNNYTTGFEHTYYRQLAGRVILRPLPTVNLELNAEYIFDNAASNKLSSIQSHHTIKKRTSMDVSYLPSFSNFTSSLHTELQIASERNVIPEQNAITTIVSLRGDYIIGSSSKLQADLGVENLDISGINSENMTIPYSLSEGREVGATFRWGAAIELKFFSDIVFGVYYDGRRNTNSTILQHTIHNARAEIRASF